MMKDPPTPDLVFRALADGTRRSLLDRLRERDGQTLGDLCEGVGMARQSVTQHIDVLASAGLVTVVHRGRVRLHFLNPEPIHRMQRRWISAFEQPRLDTLAAIRTTAEESAMSQTAAIPAYVYVTYINATVDHVWDALTNADVTAQYWRHRNVSDWQPGSTWEHRNLEEPHGVDTIGRVVQAEPPRLLRITFESPDEFPLEDPSVVTFEIEPGAAITRLQVTHEKLADTTALEQISHGWPAVLANLKSLLETGSPLPQDPWKMAPPKH